jgi:GAF domain-containing protein
MVRGEEEGMTVDSGARDLLEHAAEVARLLHAERDVAMTAEVAVELAVTLVSGCSAAGISLCRRGQVSTVASSHSTVDQADRWQYELGEGPCLDALGPGEDDVASADLTVETRWSRWAPRVVAELGLRSMVSYRLFTGTGVIGALNLYGFDVGAFTEEDILEGQVLAGQVAVALAAREQVDNLKIAVATRTTIGQAEGILMERFGLDADQAFALLTRLSRNRNQKLHHIAQDLVTTRKVPTDPTGTVKVPVRGIASSG